MHLKNDILARRSRISQATIVFAHLYSLDYESYIYKSIYIIAISNDLESRDDNLALTLYLMRDEVEGEKCLRDNQISMFASDFHASLVLRLKIKRLFIIIDSEDRQRTLIDALLVAQLLGVTISMTPPSQ